MAILNIDSASLYQLLPSLQAGSSSVTEWGWHTSLEVTCSLLSVPTARISPSPSTSQAATGAYDRLNSLLYGIVDHRRPSSDTIASALARTRSWIRRDVRQIREYLAELRSDEANFWPWLAWSIRNAWREHATRLDGLFNADFILQLGTVLEVPKNHLLKILEASKRPAVLRRWVREQNGEDFKIARDAYVLSALFRGRFHDTVAELEGRQILHHPLRRPLLKKTPNSLQRSFGISAVETRLGHIVLGAAWKERGLKSRSQRWASNLLIVRNELANWSKKDFDTVSASAAENKAVEIAHRAGIKVEPKWVERVVDLAVGFGAGALTHFLFSGWIGSAIGAAADRAAHAASVGSRVGALAVPRFRLRSLSRSGGGRVQASWQ